MKWSTIWQIPLKKVLIDSRATQLNCYILVDTLLFPLVDIIVTAFDLNLIQVKKEFYLYVHLAIGLITGGLIEERKLRYRRNYPKI